MEDNREASVGARCLDGLLDLADGLDIFLAKLCARTKRGLGWVAHDQQISVLDVIAGLARGSTRCMFPFFNPLPPADVVFLDFTVQNKASDGLEALAVLHRLRVPRG